MSRSTDDVYPLSLLWLVRSESGYPGLIGFEHTMVRGRMPPQSILKSRQPGIFYRLGSIGLRMKIAGMVAAVVVGLGLTVSLVVRSNLTRVLDQGLATHALTIARAVASHHEDAMSFQAGVSSDQLIRAMVDTDPQALYAIVQESDGSVMVKTARPEAPAERLSGVPLPAGNPSCSAAT